MSDTKKFEHFKFTLPIIKTRVEIKKTKDGKDKEVKYVAGDSSSTDLDLHGDRMGSSAIKTMADSLRHHIIKLNAEHDTSWQSELGDVTQLTVTKDNKLFMEAELNDMSKAKDLWYAVTDLNKKLGLSIGGYVKEYEMVKEEYKDEESGDMETRWVRHYKNIQLDHIAVTSSPANPKTWVGTIAKSIEKDSKLLVKKLEAKEEKLIKKSKEDLREDKKKETLKALARQLVRTVQNLEADLLLELTENALKYFVTDEQLLVLQKFMKSKNSLEAEKSLKKDDVVVESEDKTTEKIATPDTESKEEVINSKEPKEGDKAETPTMPATEKKAVEEKQVEEKTVKSESTEEPKEESETEVESEKVTPKDEDETESEGSSEDNSEDEKSEKEEKESEVKTEEESEDEAEEESKDEESEDESKEESNEESEEKKPEEPSKEKKIENESVELLKTVTKQIKEVLSVNDSLTKRIEELEKQPTGRKTVEAIDKTIGDDDKPVVNAKALKKEMDEKIADLRKNSSGDPSLFAKIQKLRADYSRKIQE